MLASLQIVWKIFARDVKRLLHNPVALIVTLGVCLLPSLYAWYCIAANWDPYGLTSEIKVAVANNDKGADSEYAGHLDVGKEVVDKLHDNHQLGWTFVNTDEAETGVKSSEYYAAIIIPANFSEDFTSIFSGTFTRPQIEYYVNEKLSSVAPKITDQGVTTLEDQIDKEFIGEVSDAVVEILQRTGKQILTDESEADNALSNDVAHISSALDDALSTSSNIRSSIDSLRNATNSARSNIDAALAKMPAIDSAANSVDNNINDVRTNLNEYVSDMETALGKAASAIASSEGILSQLPNAPDPAASAQAIEDAAQKIRAAYAQTSSLIDTISSSLSSISSYAASAKQMLEQTRASLDQLDATLDGAVSALDGTDLVLRSVKDNMDKITSDLHSLENAGNTKQIEELIGVSGDEIGNFIASPISLKTNVIYPVANYGSGVAPFYTNLALWVAGFILMAVVRMRVDPEGLPKFTKRQAYFGRWLFYIVMGLIQAAIVCIGDIIIGIQCVSPVAFVVAGLIAEFVYVNLMYALARACRHIGKAIAVILLIMQIPGASGMYPVEMMPPFFQWIHPLLPFTYSIDAMREAIGGFYGQNYLIDLLLLILIFLPIGFFVGLVIGRRAFNLNVLFDEKLRKSNLFVTENVSRDIDENKFSLSPVIKALLTTTEYRDKLIRRAQWFRRNYHKMVLAGWILIFAQPVLMLAIMFILRADVNTKLLMLCLLVIGIIAVNGYLIVITYMNSNIKYQMSSLKHSNNGSNGNVTDSSDVSSPQESKSAAITLKLPSKPSEGDAT